MALADGRGLTTADVAELILTQVAREFTEDRDLPEDLAEGSLVFSTAQLAGGAVDALALRAMFKALDPRSVVLVLPEEDLVRIEIAMVTGNGASLAKDGEQWRLTRRAA